MTETLTVNGKQLDIIPNQISRKIRVAKLGSPTEKLSSYSQQFKAPRTVNNTTILKHLGVTGNQSRMPYTSLRANYTVDTIPLVNNGYLTVEGTDSDYYSLRLTDGIIDLATRLKGLKLSDLSLSDLDHYLTATTFEDSLTNTEGYIYAFGDFGKGTTKIEHQFPSVFVHTIFTKIMQEAGIVYEGNFFTQNEDYLNEVLTSSIGVKPTEGTPTLINKGSTNTNTIDIYENSSSPIIQRDEHSFITTPITDFTYVANGIKSGISGRIKLTIDTDWSNFDSYLYMAIKVGNSTKSSINLGKGSNQSKTTELLMNIEVDDVIYIVINGYSESEYINGNEPDEFTRYELNYNVQHNVSIDEVTGGQLVSINELIGDTSQINFLKDIMSRYGLFMQPVKDNENAYSFRQIDNVLSDRENAADWTDKMVTVGAESYDSGLSKVNKMGYKYTQDIEIFSKDGELTVDNENAEPESDFYKSPFEIPLQNGTFQGETLYIIPLLEDKGEEVEPKETPSKVMSLQRVDGSLSIKYFDDVAVPYTGTIPILSLSKIGMPYLLNNYYKQYMAMMQDYVERTCELDLSVIDIHNLRLDRLYYFAQLQRYCLLEEVQHKADNNSKCKLIEIREFVTNQAPTQLANYSFEMSNGGTKTITLDNLLDGYYDPEFDEPKQIRFISGFQNSIEIYQDGVKLVQPTTINVEDMAVTIVDSSTLFTERTHTFTYTMSDIGSGNFSTETGSINATVKEYNNTPPIANAGTDKTLQLYGDQPYTSKSVYLNGSGSTDSTGEIVKWTWEFISKPSSSDAEIIQSTFTPSATVRYDNEYNSRGNYTLRLTVEDEFGLTDTDTMTVDVDFTAFTP